MLVRTVLAFLVVCVLHAWMVVVNNDGFAPDIARPVYHYIAFAHQRGETVLFWSFSAYVLSALFSRLVFGGGKQVFKDLARIPGYTVRTMSRTGRGTFPLLFLAVALAQLPALLLKNPSLIWVLPIALLFSYSMQGRGLAHLMLSCGWNDLRRLRKRASHHPQEPVAVLVFGLLMGLVASALLLGKHPWNWLLSLVCLGGFLLLMRRGEKLRLAVHLHLLWLAPTAGLLMSFLVGMLRLFADDGGWYESGGTLSLWWNAPGREDALAMGFPPALGASLGALFGGNFVVSTDPDLQVMVADPNSGASDSIPADSAFPEVQVAGEPDTPMPETVPFHKRMVRFKGRSRRRKSLPLWITMLMAGNG